MNCDDYFTTFMYEVAGRVRAGYKTQLGELFDTFVCSILRCIIGPVDIEIYFDNIYEFHFQDASVSFEF